MECLCLTAGLTPRVLNEILTYGPLTHPESTDLAMWTLQAFLQTHAATEATKIARGRIITGVKGTGGRATNAALRNDKQIIIQSHDWSRDVCV